MTLVLRHAAQLVGLTAPGETRRAGSAMRRVDLVEDGAVVIEGQRIAWLGKTAELPLVDAEATVVDLHGKVVLPGLIDSHTHAIFAGDRVGEWEERLAGASYQEIAARGGGIASTVRAVRKTSRDDLVALARPRFQRML